MDTKKVGAFIAKCRKEKGLTQKQLAEAIGVSDKSVSKWEAGANLPQSALFVPLCECLEIEVQELIKGEKIEKEKLMEESNQLLIDLAGEQKDAVMWFETWVFFLLLPIILIFGSMLLSPIFSLFDTQLIEAALILYTPFTFVYNLLKAIECIKHEKNYFRYFFFASISFFILLMGFMSIR